MGEIKGKTTLSKHVYPRQVNFTSEVHGSKVAVSQNVYTCFAFINLFIHTVKDNWMLPFIKTTRKSFRDDINIKICCIRRLNAGARTVTE